MYLEYFKLNELPFSLTPNTNYFCNLDTYQEALNVLMLSLYDGEGFIKVVGEVGTGKTTLCRELLNRLEDLDTKHNNHLTNLGYVVAYLNNPPSDAVSFRIALAQELGITIPDKITYHDLLLLINAKLIELSQAHKRIVIIIDEAQILSVEGLEGLRLLSNLETESKKLLQIILFGQPELDKKLASKNLRQLKQRIAFSYTLRPFNTKELITYINHRLTKAGNPKLSSLFSKNAISLLKVASRGIPRLVNILCHKALLVAYGRNYKKITSQAIKLAILDTESIAWRFVYRIYDLSIGLILLLFVELGLAIYLIKNYLL